MAKSSTRCAGIDTGKRKLDVALAMDTEQTDGGQLRVDNRPAGHAELSGWLRRHGVERVGIEASGGYEGAVVAALRRDGFLVAVLQPAQVRAYGKFLLRRAKNDRIDAALIAACTAAVERIRAPADPRLAALAEPLRLLEQLSEDIARLKTRRESCREERIQAHWTAEIARLKRIRRAELKALAAAVEEHADLAARLELIASIDGIGLLTAIAILVRLPEIGQLSRAEVAALAGLAPYDDQSGRRDGARHIAGGRERLRHAVYSAAFAAAFHWNAPLKALYHRLVAAGKEHKVALVACARKLLIYANTVVTRGTPWQTRPAAG
jgi:transposase